MNDGRHGTTYDLASWKATIENQANIAEVSLDLMVDGEEEFESTVKAWLVFRYPLYRPGTRELDAVYVLDGDHVVKVPSSMVPTAKISKHLEAQDERPMPPVFSDYANRWFPYEGYWDDVAEEQQEYLDSLPPARREAVRRAWEMEA